MNLGDESVQFGGRADRPDALPVQRIGLSASRRTSVLVWRQVNGRPEHQNDRRARPSSNAGAAAG